MKPVKEFNLTGIVSSEDDMCEMWSASITLSTPDGKRTKIESGFCYKTEKEAKENMQANMDNILREFQKDGVEIVEKDGVKLQ